MGLFGRKKDLAGQHVLITGGSQGLGLSLAHEAVRRKASVTIVARTEARLQAAKAELEADAKRLGLSSVQIAYQAADLTDPDAARRAMAAAINDLGPVDLLICNAGAARPGYFHEMDLSIFRQQMEVNYYGVLHTVHALYGDMVKRNKGHIVITGSALSSFGLIGYAAYCPSKYAAKGLADCLRNELKGTKVKVSFAAPPDTNTPGFAEENKSKPIETKEASEGGSTLYSPEKVAGCLMHGILSGTYALPTPDLGLQFNNIATLGLIPRSFPGVLLHMLVGFIAPPIQWAFAAFFDSVARKHVRARFARLWDLDGPQGDAAGAPAAQGASAGEGERERLRAEADGAAAAGAGEPGR